MSDNPLAALAMRERAVLATREGYPEDGTYGPHELEIQEIERATCDVIAAAIRALPTTFTDAELLAAAMQLPEVRALVEAAIDMRDYGTVLAEQKYHHNLAAALVPFMKGGDK